MCITDSKVKLVIPTTSDSTAAAVTQQQEENQSAGELQTDERQFSPPVSKEEIASDDLISVHESAGKTINTVPAEVKDGIYVSFLVRSEQIF